MERKCGCQMCNCCKPAPKPKKCCKKTSTKKYVCTKTTTLKCCEVPKPKCGCAGKWEPIMPCECGCAKKHKPAPTKCCDCCEVNNFFENCVFECKGKKPVKKVQYVECDDDYGYDDDCDCDCDC